MAKPKGKAYAEYRDGKWHAEFRDGANVTESLKRGGYDTKQEAVDALFERMGDRERGVNIIQPASVAGPEGEPSAAGNTGPQSPGTTVSTS